VLAQGRAQTTTTASVAGRYNLVAAAGQSLPAIVAQNPATGYKQEVTSGYVDLRADRTCTVATEYRTTDQGQTSTSSSRDEGTYTVSGDKLTLTFGREQLLGKLTGGVLTVRTDVELVYRKQSE
jgi:hypothetical protein